jgi:hypothetical protein
MTGIYQGCFDYPESHCDSVSREESEAISKLRTIAPTSRYEIAADGSPRSTVSELNPLFTGAFFHYDGFRIQAALLVDPLHHLR